MDWHMLVLWIASEVQGASSVRLAHYCFFSNLYPCLTWLDLHSSEEDSDDDDDDDDH